ncbi:MAG: histidine triad nucleotide-binding protein [Clostridiales bacterium]|nr:histidine triad nucleotide-binding protein [Clostridiales bacterium]
MENCIFCRIAAGQIPANFLYEDEDIAAFRDINPRAPVHVLIIPKKHIASLAEIEEADTALLGRICLVARQLAENEGIAASGYRLISNCGTDSGQEVAHLHFHLLGGQFLGAFTTIIQE